MATAVPNLAVATAIGSAIGTWTLGTNLFAGPIRQPDTTGTPSPIKCVFCLASGGPPPS